jgi:outer membrane protein
MRFWIAICLAWPLAAQAPLKLTLQEAEALAIEQQPRVAEARVSTLAAAQVTRETRSALYPQVSGSTTVVGASENSRVAAGYLTAGTLPSRVAAGGLFQQLITDFGRTKHLIASSRLHEQSQGQSEEAIRASVLLDVDQAYFRSLRASALLRVAQETTRARQVVADQVAALTRSNLKSQLDLSFAQVNLSEAQLLEATAQSEIDEAFAELSNALGFSTPQKFDLTEVPMTGPPDPDVEALTRQALVDRPDVKELRLEQNALLETAEAERALSRPVVSVAAAAGGIPFHNSTLNDYYAGAGFNITVPVLNGSLFAARRSEAELRAQGAAVRVRQIENQVAKEVHDAWLDANTAYKRIALTDQLLEQASLSLDLAQSRYDLGLSSIVELSQAQLNKTSAEIQSLTARYEFQTQLSGLRYQIGALR